MHLSRHFIISSVLAAISYPFFGWQSIFLFIGGFFIDGDHYLWYIFTKKNFNLKKAYHFHLNNDLSEKKIIDIFHTAEFWILILLASLLSNSYLPYYHTAILAFTFGIYSHIICDLIHEYNHHKLGIDARVYSFYSRALHLKRKNKFTFWNMFKD
ncbi:hypothetical protein HZA96_04955 [Candidatus Woesearchaeota archaeon]|nr:hypothetical protein [Candidatus Woesearchaeota archaeon]